MFYVKTVAEEKILHSSSSSFPPFFNEMEQPMPLALLPLILLMQSVKTPLLQQHRCDHIENTLLHLGILFIYYKMCDVQHRTKTEATGEFKYFPSYFFNSLRYSREE